MDTWGYQCQAQESFKRLVSTGGLVGREGVGFCHWETEPSPSQPQLELEGISPEPQCEEDHRKAQVGLERNLRLVRAWNEK